MAYSGCDVIVHDTRLKITGLCHGHFLISEPGRKDLFITSTFYREVLYNKPWIESITLKMLLHGNNFLQNFPNSSRMKLIFTQTI